MANEVTKIDVVWINPKFKDIINDVDLNNKRTEEEAEDEMVQSFQLQPGEVLYIHEPGTNESQ